MIRTALLLATLAMPLSVPASAQAPRSLCVPYNQIAEVIRLAFGETIHHRGLRANGGALDIYADNDGNWTAVQLFPSGLACVVMAGKHWITIPLEPEGEPI